MKLSYLASIIVIFSDIWDIAVALYLEFLAYARHLYPNIMLEGACRHATKTQRYALIRN